MEQKKSESEKAYDAVINQIEEMRIDGEPVPAELYYEEQVLEMQAGIFA